MPSQNRSENYSSPSTISTLKNATSKLNLFSWILVLNLTVFIFNLYKYLDSNLYVPIPLNYPTPSSASTNIAGKIIDYVKY